MGYFDHPYCSNSGLSALGRELGILPEMKGDIYEAYRWGSLLDAVVTEPTLLDLIQMRILGTDYTFTREELQTCKTMKKVLESNRLYQAFLRCNPDYQKEVYIKDFSFGDFTLNMRGKLDYYLPGLVADLKSSATNSQTAFEAACGHFGYWRQMVLYCKLTGADKATIWGVSKVPPHKVFQVIIRKGDERWKEGEQQLYLLAKKYYLTAA